MIVSNRLIVCCDAILAVRFVSDPGAAAVHRLWERWIQIGTTVVAPSLLHYEVANAVHRIALRDGADDEDALELLSEVMRLPIEIRHVPGHHQRAQSISRAFRLPATYDAHYLALAESLRCTFYTSDSKLFKAVSPSFEWISLVE